jgi:hypothetical protein
MPAACAGRINIVQCQGQWRFDVSFHVFPLFLNVSFANSECDGDQFRSSPSSPFPSHVIRHAPKSRLGTKPHPADPAASNSLAHPTVGKARRPGSELNTWLVSILASANDNSLRIKTWLSRIFRNSTFFFRGVVVIQCYPCYVVCMWYCWSFAESLLNNCCKINGSFKPRPFHQGLTWASVPHGSWHQQERERTSQDAIAEHFQVWRCQCLGLYQRAGAPLKNRSTNINNTYYHYIVYYIIYSYIIILPAFLACCSTEGLFCTQILRLRKRPAGFHSFAPWMSTEPAICTGPGSSRNHGLVRDFHIFETI